MKYVQFQTLKILGNLKVLRLRKLMTPSYHLVLTFCKINTRKYDTFKVCIHLSKSKVLNPQFHTEGYTIRLIKLKKK